MSEIPKAMLVEQLKEALDAQIEVCEEFLYENDPKDSYMLAALQVIRRNVDSISTEPTPKGLLCIECGKRLDRECGR